MPADHLLAERAAPAERSESPGRAAGIPRYLIEQYAWAYLHPAGIALFDHPWIVNLILWGNFNRLRQAALDALGPGELSGRTLQVACVYGDLTARLAARLDADGALDVIDVVPQQLAKLHGKVVHDPRVVLRRADSEELGGPDGRYDRALIFFLLHEQPEAVRSATLREAIRVVRPGGRIVIVDYHRPARAHPLRYLMRPVLRWLEPFALDLWRHDLQRWLPDGGCEIEHRQQFFGGLYQLLVLNVRGVGAARPGGSAGAA